MTNAISSGSQFPIDSLNGSGRMVSNPKGELDNQAFLNLLVAQLKYQDPMSPTDSSALMQQTSTLTQVEMIKESTAAQQLATASNLIGRTVTYIDSGKTILKVSGMEAELTSVTKIS